MRALPTRIILLIAACLLGAAVGAFSPDPAPLEGEAVRLGSSRFRLTDRQDGVHSIAVSRDGKRLVADGTIFDAATGRAAGSLPTDNPALFSPDGRLMAVTAYLPIAPGATTARGVSLHDAKSGRLLRTLDFGENGGLGAGAFSSDGRLLAVSRGTTNDRNAWVDLWDTATGKRVRQMAGRPSAREPAEALAFTGGNGTLIAICDASVKAWDVASGKVLRRYAADVPSRTIAIVFSPDGGRFAIGREHGGLDVLESLSGRVLLSSNAKDKLTYYDDGGIVAIAFSPDGESVASAGDNGVIRVRTILSHRQRFRLDTHWNATAALAFSADGRRLIAGYDQGIRSWDIATGKEISPSPGHYSPITSLAFSPDGSRLISTGSPTERLRPRRVRPRRTSPQGIP